MKKIATFLLFVMLLSMFSLNAFAGAPESQNGAGLSIAKVSGDLSAPGSSTLYMIFTSDGKVVESLDDYEIIRDIRVPLQMSDITITKTEGATFRVSLLDTCSIGDIPYSGKITFRNKITNESTSLTFDGVARNVVNPITGNINVSLGSGSKVYDFSNTTGTTTIVFGENAELRLSGVESGAKCLAYNLDPNQSIRTKYNLNNSNSAFINFVGKPEFQNKITITFMIPIDAPNPVLYQLNSGTTNELEEVHGYKVVSNGPESVIRFESTSLKETYVIVTNKLDGVAQAEPVELPETTEPVQDNVVTTDSSEPSPQTGSNFVTYATLLIVSVGLLGLVFKRKNI
jgi:hypothetical protein